MSRSAGIRERRGASLLLLPAAYDSVQNLVTSVILDGSARFVYHFVVLFYTLKIALFPPFFDLSHFRSSFDVPST